MPFFGSNYDSTTFIIGYLLPDGTIGELPNSLDFSMDVRVLDMYGNAFLMGSATDRSQSATIGSTSLGWTYTAAGSGCWSINWISPKFITHYNYSLIKLLIGSTKVTSNTRLANGAGFGLNKLTSVLFFKGSGTVQSSQHGCSGTPGTHTFGSHTTSGGEIVGADGTGHFRYVYNPTVHIQPLGTQSLTIFILNP